MECSWKSRVVARGRSWVCTVTSRFLALSGFGILAPVDVSTISPMEFSPWIRRKIPPCKIQKGWVLFSVIIWWWQRSSIDDPTSWPPRRKMAIDDWELKDGCTTMPIMPYSAHRSRCAEMPPYSSWASFRQTMWAALRNTTWGKLLYWMSVRTHFGNLSLPPIYGTRLMWPRFRVRMQSW